MTKLWLVALYEYKRNVFKRSFILVLLSVPLMIGLNAGIGLFLESRGNNNAPVGYVDHAGLLADPVPAPVTGPREAVEFIPFQTEDDARAALQAKDIQAYYVVAADYFETSRIDLMYLAEPGKNATRQFYDFIQINLLAGQPPEIAHRAADGTDVIVRSLDGRRQVPSGGPTLGLMLPLFISMAFLFLLIMSSGYLMQVVADEKENCTMEVLVTSVSPMQLIGGKVLGIVAISFTQLITWTAIGILAILIAGSAGIEWFQDPSLDWEIILMRNFFAVVPLWQIAASVAIQTLCVVGMLWLASRAFRLGMLRYGQRLRWRELMKARS